MIEGKTYKGAQPGKNLLVFGAIHGNETCGPDAIRRVMECLDKGEIIIQAGQVTFIPVCNPEAYKADKRYIEVNLNRVMKLQANPTQYEEKIAVELMSFIDDCDVLLDLHSMHTASPPFVFQDTDDKALHDFSAALNVPNIVVGWPDLYQGEDNTTAGYARTKNKLAVTVECGKHHDYAAIRVGVMCIERALQYMGLVPLGLVLVDTQNFVRVRMTDKIIKHSATGEFIKPWDHMDRLDKGDVITKGDMVMTAPYDGFMILPFHEAQQGDEWYYLGKVA